MTKIVLTALALSTLVVGVMTCSTRANAETASLSYAEAMKLCGAEWRNRADKDTRKGRDAWNAFRAQCVVQKGYVKQKRGNADRRKTVTQ